MKAYRGLVCRAAAGTLQERTEAGPDWSGSGWTGRVAEGSVGRVPPPSTGSSSSFLSPLLYFSSLSFLCSFSSVTDCGE